MMSKRIEAAAQGVADYWGPIRGHRREYDECDIGVASWALVASDKILFSVEAIEKAARRLWIKDADAEIGFWGNLDETVREYYRDLIREVIRALKEE